MEDSNRGVLLLKDKRRFMDLLREVEGNGAKMLSKELQELEQNQLVTRTLLAPSRWSMN